MTQAASRIVHPLEPLWDAQSRVLILGTMPSPRSRAAGFYYAHPQNRFWRTLAAVFDEPVPQTTAERQAFAHRHHIALWDVLHACDICGAADDTIRAPEVNDFRPLLQCAPIRLIATTGSTAARLYRRCALPQTGREALALPSTSPANCRWYTQARLIEAYRVLRPVCDAAPEQ